MVSSSSAALWRNVTSLDLVFQGLSFLDLRYQLLLFYLQDLTHLISLKTDGVKIKESEAIQRAVTIRTVRPSTNTLPSLLYHITYDLLLCLKILSHHTVISCPPGGQVGSIELTGHVSTVVLPGTPHHQRIQE